MHQIIQQRNSFNNFHNFVGNGEDDDWEERQRQWRKESFRNEREDVRRGQWAIKEPLDVREAEWMQRVKSDNDLWHRVHNPDTGREEWQLIDPYNQRWYDKLTDKEKEHNASVDYAQTRLRPREYYNRKFEIENPVSTSQEFDTRESQTVFILQEYGFPVASNT